jgi:hypothetical protein
MINKRGRKRLTEQYFGPNEEKAVNDYLASTDDAERNKIYNQWLKAPLNKMVESIIRKYKLYRKGETFEDLHTDTLSFLMTKAHKFEDSRGKKAYSYYGTICKHYILGLLIKDEKYLTKTSSYEDISSSVENREDLSYVIDDYEPQLDVFLNKLVVNIQSELNEEQSSNKKKLTDNEKKVGKSLVSILENWETFFNSMNGSSKYNKNSILETMRNYTNLSTKDIRLAMKRYKELYSILKHLSL